MPRQRNSLLHVLGFVVLGLMMFHGLRSTSDVARQVQGGESILSKIRRRNHRSTKPSEEPSRDTLLSTRRRVNVTKAMNEWNKDAYDTESETHLKLVLPEMSVDEKNRLYRVHHVKDGSFKWLQTQAVADAKSKGNEQGEFEATHNKRKRAAASAQKKKLLNTRHDMDEDEDQKQQRHEEDETQDPTGENGSFRCHCAEFHLGDQRQHWCPGAGGQGASTLGSSHACIVKDVCLTLDHKILIRGAEQGPPPKPGVRREATEQVNVRLANTAGFLFHVVHQDQITEDGISWAHHLSEDSFYSDQDTTLVLLGHSASHHITHFLEPVGNFNMAVKTMMQGEYPALKGQLSHGGASPTGGGNYRRGKQQQPKRRDVESWNSMSVRNSTCSDDDLTCFHPPSHVVSNKAPMNAGSWQQHVLRVAMGDVDGASWTGLLNQIPVQRNIFSRNTGLRCWRKAVIPGAFYGLWPQSQDTTPFHRDLYSYLRRGESESETVGAPMVDNETGEDRGRKRQLQLHRSLRMDRAGGKRTILIAHRTTKRRVTDAEDFKQLVAQVGRRVNAVVQQVGFGSKSFYEQAALAREADILIGIHGADLTNMIFQNRGSVVIELNPLYFFENRFFELANALHLSYLSWTCTSDQCAFGGNSNRYEQYAQQHGLQYQSRDTSIVHNGKRFQWNWIGYTGMACPECNQMSCCGPIHAQYYTVLRDSSIKIGPPQSRHGKEIEALLGDAFLHLGWERISE